MIQLGLRFYFCLFLLLSILGRGNAIAEDPKVDAKVETEADTVDSCAPDFNFVEDAENPCNNTQYHLDHGITEEDEVIESIRHEV